MTIYIILIIIIIFMILIINKFKTINSDFNSVLIKIHDGENEIDELLNKKGTLLDEICEAINNINDKIVFSSIKKITKKNIDSLKLDRELSEAYAELKEYLIVNKSFIPEDELKNKIDELSEVEINLKATKLFYNDNSNVFNELIESFPAKIIARKKDYDFKFLYTFEEEQFFEILKKDKKKKKEA